MKNKEELLDGHAENRCLATLSAAPSQTPPRTHPEQACSGTLCVFIVLEEGKKSHSLFTLCVSPFSPSTRLIAPDSA